MKTNQIAINSISTRHKDLDEALASYAAAGFRHVEFAIPQVKQWMNTPSANARSAADLKTLLAKHGLDCIGGFETSLTAFGDAEARKKNHALHIANATLMSELSGGAPITLVMGTDGDSVNNLDTLKAIGRTARELAREFPRGAKIGLEFNWSPVMKSLRSASVVVEEANDDRVGILFDPAHYHCTPSKFDDLTPKVVKQIVHVHVDDMRDKPGDRSDCNADRVLPGEGVVGIKKLIDHLEALGYRGLFSIEMFSEELWAMPSQVAAKKMYDAMTRLAS